jgi:hypothetical protein
MTVFSLTGGSKSSALFHIAGAPTFDQANSFQDTWAPTFGTFCNIQDKALSSSGHTIG